MAERPPYVILGRGHWAGRMHSILTAGGRRVTCIGNTRKETAESEEIYTERLISALRASSGRIAWLCVPPGSHVISMMRAATEAGVHAIAEKPWMVPASQTEALANLAARREIVLGVHFEYCLLDELEAWRKQFESGRGLRFGGRFSISAADRLGMPAGLNLGCHLHAMRRYAVPQTKIGELTCAYESRDERRAWLEDDTRVVDSIDFTHNRQPLIQRFFERFEAAIEGAAFPFRIDFGLEVTNDLSRSLAPQTAASHRP